MSAFTGHKNLAAWESVLCLFLFLVFSFFFEYVCVFFFWFFLLRKLEVAKSFAKNLLVADSND